LRAGGFEPAGRRALVLGAGGGARAVVYALGRAGCAVALHNRTALRAGALAREFDALGLPVTPVAGLGRLDLDAFDLLVNATSVGMAPGVDASPWPDALPLPAHWSVYDLVYNPAQTRLLARAEDAGARAIGGLSMLVHQGALAFRLWTGEPAPVDIMHAAAREALP
jgi:shikimate dehydrogenase